MSIFSKRKKPGFLALKPGNILPHGAPAKVDFDTVLDYLLGLSEEDFSTVGKIAAIYRKADEDAAKALGVDNKPTVRIGDKLNLETVPAHINHVHPMSFLEDDEDADIAAIMDDPQFIATDQPGKKTNVKIAVKEQA